MRTLSLLLLVILSLLTPPPAAAAAPAGVFFEDFCADPMKAVCGTILTSPLGRDAGLLKIAQESAAQARADLGLDSVDNRGASRFATDKLPPAERAAALGRLQERLIFRLRERVGQAEWAAVQGTVGRIRGLLEDAITRTFNGTPERQRAAAQLQGILRHVRVLDSGSLRQLLAEGKERDAPLLAEAYQSHCGTEGLAQNAFAAVLTRPERTARYFIVCPGLLLSALGGGQDARGNMENLIFVMGHELSHHFDAQKLPALYQDYQRCLSERAGSALPGPLAPRMGEISADHWGTEVLVGYLQGLERALPLSHRDRLWALRQGTGALCDAKDDGTHPSGAFRIGILLRHHPGVLSAMRCPVPADSRACSLRGAIPVLTHPERLFAPRP